MRGITSLPVVSYLERSLPYLITPEWTGSLSHIFENRLFRYTMTDLTLSREVESLQFVFAAAGTAQLIIDIRTLVRAVTTITSSSLQAWTVVATVATLSYSCHRFFNKLHPIEVDCDHLLTLQIPQSVKKKIKVSLFRPFKNLQFLCIARIFSNSIFLFSTPHKIPHAINTLCQAHTLFMILCTHCLKFSRTRRFLNREECIQEAQRLPDPFRNTATTSLQNILAHCFPIEDETLEAYFVRLRQSQPSIPSGASV